ncbi:MAG: chromate transporter [Gemmatimonadaceae bacterium]
MTKPSEDLAEGTIIRRPTSVELFRYFLSLGTTGFGGPIALVGYMEREFVDHRHWVTRQELKDGLAFAQLAPGPLAAQLAIYLGWLCSGVRGATMSAIAFVAPSFLMVLALAVLYLRYDGITWLQGAFYGIGAAVIAIIGRSAFKLVRATLATDGLMWAIFAISAVTTAWTESEKAWLFIVSGVLAMGLRGTRRSSNPTVWSLTVGPGIMPRGLWAIPEVASGAGVLLTVFLYFAGAGLFVFGSGLAIVPFLHGGVVQQHHWLTERQFLDAVAVALVTPGPVVITVAFIGYLVAGLGGAIVAAAGVFAPVYFITILLAPHYERLKSDVRVRAFVDGVTASATGAIAGAAYVLGRRAIVDVPTLLIAAVTLVLLLRAKKLPEPLVILGAGLAGVGMTGLR